jgi:hypothetical protein
VKNYSYIKNKLLHEFAEWLGIPEHSLNKSKVAVINRSLTYGELEFQRYVNEILGPSGHFVSDVLCNELPNVQANQIVPALNVQLEMINRLSPSMERVNSEIPEDQRYKTEPIEGEGPPSEIFTFNRKQLKILAHGLAKGLLESRTEQKQ